MSVRIRVLENSSSSHIVPQCRRTKYDGNRARKLYVFNETTFISFRKFDENSVTRYERNLRSKNVTICQSLFQVIVRTSCSDILIKTSTLILTFFKRAFKRKSKLFKHLQTVKFSSSFSVYRIVCTDTRIIGTDRLNNNRLFLARRRHAFRKLIIALGKCAFPILSTILESNLKSIQTLFVNRSWCVTT